MDWFICKAASTELLEPPSHEKISFRHAFLSSLQDKTASMITQCFETTLKEAHASLFPLAQPEIYAPPPALYSELPHSSISLFDSQPSASPPSPSLSQPHPLAPTNPSSLLSTIIQNPLSSPQNGLSQPPYARRSLNFSRSSPPSTVPNNLPTPFPRRAVERAPNEYARAYGPSASTRSSRSNTQAPPVDVALPAPSPMGVLFRRHLSRDGRGGPRE